VGGRLGHGPFSLAQPSRKMCHFSLSARSGAHITWEAAGQIVFSIIIFTEHNFVIFCPIFGKISSYFFLFKLIQRKVCLENIKVTEILLKSIKFMNSLFIISTANS
jgi:hypothetical protein